MSEIRQNRKDAQVLKGDPLNFTCGKCMKVVPWNKDLLCPSCDVKAKEE